MAATYLTFLLGGPLLVLTTVHFILGTGLDQMVSRPVRSPYRGGQGVPVGQRLSCPPPPCWSPATTTSFSTVSGTRWAGAASSTCSFPSTGRWRSTRGPWWTMDAEIQQLDGHKVFNIIILLMSYVGPDFQSQYRLLVCDDVTQPNLTDLRSSDVDIVLSIAGLQTTRAQGPGTREF